ncbi:MAG: cysteine hydrolase [Prolixibacteraceae bacterium]|nr:cysteine hydrolase [Prolixibacteraceae bacterium]
MTISVKDNPALILIDIQKGFDDVNYWGGDRNNPDAEKNAGKLLAFWRKMGLPVFHAKHCSSNPNSRLAEGQPGNEFQDVVAPIDGEIIIKKNVNSAFIGTDLKQQLDTAHITKLVIAGLTTDQCVSTSVRMAGNFGYDTYVLEDATATFCKKGTNGQLFSAEIIHETALASLNDEFATVIKTETLLEALNILDLN